jgi:hypothetical protein
MNQGSGETEWLTPLGYVNAVVKARKRAKTAEAKLLERVPEEAKAAAAAMLKVNDGK